MFNRVPIVALMIAILALAMMVPCIQAVSDKAWPSARAFFYSSVFCLLVSASIGVLLRPMSRSETAQHELLTLVLIWLFLPVFAAIPLGLLTPAIGVSGAYFEMVAAFTTTGGSVYSKASDVPPAIHLWRGLVGWGGGLVTLLAAYVILAPRRLGGFEVMASDAGLLDGGQIDLRVSSAAFEGRLLRALRIILPAYFGMTVVIGVGFSAFDKPGLVAAVHAMSIVSTSGISPLANGFAEARNIYAEMVALIFMVLAATRFFYSDASQTGGRVDWRSDPELRLMFGLVAAATSILFIRHWVGVLTIDSDLAAVDGFEALWGGLFTTLSFLTTTGFQSFAWESARDWSGLANPGLILLALCMIGGGAATTAGGIKLIRAYALIRHGARELERIAQPHSVGGAGNSRRGLRREGAFIAWAFMMLFILALLLAVLCLTLTGMKFTPALIAAVAALANTGPAIALGAAEWVTFATLDGIQRGVLAIAMVLGRIETLAVIALFSPQLWENSTGRVKSSGNSRY